MSRRSGASDALETELNLDVYWRSAAGLSLVYLISPCREAGLYLSTLGVSFGCDGPVGFLFLVQGGADIWSEPYAKMYLYA